MLRIGLFGARCDNGGLSNQSKEFYDHMKPAKTLLVYGVTNRKDHFERFPGAMTETMPIPNETIDMFLKGLDVVFTIEVPYNYYLFKRAKELGVKTVMQYNYEFLYYFADPSLPYPDLLLAPSKWHIKEVTDAFGEATKVSYMPVPVNRKVLPFKQKSKARTFVHIAGPVLHEDRNGTNIVLDSLKFIKDKIKVIIYTQHEITREIVTGKNVKLDIRYGDVENYWDMYQEGDVLLLPRRYGGLSLQLNEAMSAGFIPIMPNCGPQNTFLNPFMLSFVSNSHELKLTPSEKIISYEVEPRSLAYHMQILRGMNKSEIEKLSQYSNLYATLISWDNLRKKYAKILHDLVRGKS